MKGIHLFILAIVSLMGATVMIVTSNPCGLLFAIGGIVSLLAFISTFGNDSFQ